MGLNSIIIHRLSTPSTTASPLSQRSGQFHSRCIYDKELNDKEEAIIDFAYKEYSRCHLVQSVYTW